MSLLHLNAGRTAKRVAVRSRAAKGAAAAIATCIGAMALALPSSGAADGATYYVDAATSRCSDARPAAQNTLSTPWCSIPRALKAAPAGSTVQLRAGDYPQVVVADAHHSAFVKLTPFPGETPRIAGMELDGVDHLRFEGLTFTDGIGVRTGDNLQFVDNEVVLRNAGARTSSALILTKTRAVLYQGNHVLNGRDGVNIDGSRPASSDITIWRNHFENLSNDAIHMSTGTSRVLIGANFIDDVRLRPEVDPAAHADGLQAMGPTQDVVVWGNYVSGGRGFLFMVSPRDQAKKGYGHRGTVIESNVFVGRDFAVRTFSTPGARIVNNTVWGTSSSDTSGIDITNRVGAANDKSTGLTLVNNVVKRLRVLPGVTFEQRDHNVIQKGPKAGPHDVLATPRFVDPAGGDYRLAPGSVGVDGGSAALASAVDLEGRSRLGLPDAGAFETNGAFAGDVFSALPAGITSLLASSGATEDVRADLAVGGLRR